MTSPIENLEKKADTRKRPLAVGLIVVVCAAAALWAFSGNRTAKQTEQGGPQAVPVTVASVSRADVPVYVSGPGNVQALNTVTVNSRVDGQIQKIAFKEGQDVKVGDLLARIDPRPFQAALDQAVAKKAQDIAQLENAKLDLDRYSRLASDNYASKQQLDSQKALVAQYTAQVQSDDAAIDNARTQLSYTTIVSPINGRTGLRLIDEGNIVHANDTSGIVTIVQTQPIAAVVAVPERYLPELASATRAGPVEAIAFGSGNRTQLAVGKLEIINNQVDKNSGTIKVKADFANTDHSLWPGQFVNVRLLVKTLPQAVVVADDAILRGQQGLYVYLVKAGGDTVEARYVSAGPSANGKTAIMNGLTPGDQVVVAGQSRLFPNARIQASPAPSDQTSKASPASLPAQVE